VVHQARYGVYNYLLGIGLDKHAGEMVPAIDDMAAFLSVPFGDVVEEYSTYIAVEYGWTNRDERMLANEVPSV